MTDLWMPGAVRVPQPGGVVLDTSLPPRFVWHITWDALQPDGAQPAFSAVAGYLQSKQYCPHIMWNPFTGYMEQYYPANVGSRALAFNDQDGTACIQVEVFFTPGCVVDGVKYDAVTDTPLIGWADLLAWADSLGVPRAWPMGAPQWSGNSRDADVWNNNAGHYGHCHSPGDTHTDPGPMPPLTGTAIQPQSTITVQEDDMDPNTIFTSKDGAKVSFNDFLNSIDRKVEVAMNEATNAKNIATDARNEATNAKNNSADAAGRVSYAYSNLPAQVLNQSFTLPDGTTTNLAGILAAIHATPATVTNVTGASIDVDALVARLKTELPTAVLAQLTTKLSQP